MFKVLISSKLASLLMNSITKQAADSDDWRDRYVMHTTPGGKQTKVKIRSLPPEEQARYAPQKPTHKEFTPIPQIQSEIKDFQTALSTGNTKQYKRSFEKLYANFLPVIKKIINKTVGERKYTTTPQDFDDIKQQAAQIFVKTIQNADPNNNGIVKYIVETLTQQLKGTVRQIYRSPVSMEPKQRKVLRAVQRYVHDYNNKNGTMPQDYEQMARDINKQDNDITTDASEITALLQSGVVSLEEQIDEGSEGGRDTHDVLGPSNISSDAGDVLPTPEEEVTAKDLKNTVLKIIESIGDETKQKILKLTHGLMPQDQLPEGYHEGEPLNARQISEVLNIPRSTVTRELKRAEFKLRQNPDIQRLRQSNSILRIIKAYNRHIRLAYTPDSVIRIAKDSVLLDNKFLVKKFANQIVCNCQGQNCFHKDAAKQYLK